MNHLAHVSMSLSSGKEKKENTRFQMNNIVQHDVKLLFTDSENIYNVFVMWFDFYKV